MADHNRTIKNLIGSATQIQQKKKMKLFPTNNETKSKEIL